MKDVPDQGPDGSNHNWVAVGASGCPKVKWVRGTVNTGPESYDVLEAKALFPEPYWPDCTLQQSLEIAFEGRVSDTMEHPAWWRCS
jgi:hypothetical protein